MSVNINRRFRVLRKLVIAYVDELNLGELQELAMRLVRERSHFPPAPRDPPPPPPPPDTTWPP